MLKEGLGSYFILGGQLKTAFSFAFEISGREKLCMVPYHSCNIYRIWKSKNVRGRSKVVIWDSNADQKGRGVLMG